MVLFLFLRCYFKESTKWLSFCFKTLLWGVHQRTLLLTLRCCFMEPMKWDSLLPSRVTLRSLPNDFFFIVFKTFLFGACQMTIYLFWRCCLGSPRNGIIVISRIYFRSPLKGINILRTSLQESTKMPILLCLECWFKASSTYSFHYCSTASLWSLSKWLTLVFVPLSHGFF